MTDSLTAELNAGKSLNGELGKSRGQGGESQKRTILSVLRENAEGGSKSENINAPKSNARDNGLNNGNIGGSCNMSRDSVGQEGNGIAKNDQKEGQHTLSLQGESYLQLR